MKETLEWIADIELKACEIYSRAALYFSGDEDFADFVRALGADEKEHHAVICRAVELVEKEGGFSFFARVDESYRDQLMESLVSVDKAMQRKVLTREEFIECVVYLEFSEWNDHFMHVMNAMKRRFSAFVPVAVGVERHKKSIERFLERRGEFKASLEAIKSLPSLWAEKILVVDDEEMISELFSALLSDEGKVDVAGNGAEALEMIGRNYYAAVISDIDMPVMDGIELYKRASEMYPGIVKRFLFFSGEFDRERLDFIKENNIKYLPKPSSIQEIKKAVIEILG